MKKHPESIPLNVQWSFAEQAPSDLNSFTATVKTYNKSLSKDAGFIFGAMNYFGRSMLTHDTGLKQIKLKYTYAVETPSGDWETKENIIDVVSASKSLTPAEILFLTHFKAQHHLADQDHCHLEELFLLEETKQEAIPTYELFLGS